MTVTSITPQEGDRFGIAAGGDIAGQQYRAVKQVDGLAELAIDGDIVLGVLQDEPAAARRATYIPHGYSKVVLGEAVAENESIGALADSRFGSSSGTLIGRAIEEGQPGDVVWAWVNTFGGTGNVGGGLTSSQVQALIDASIPEPAIIPYGDGSTKQYTLSHTLGTDRFSVYVEETSTGEEAKPTIVDRTTTTVVIRHAFAPSTNQFTAVLEVS